MNKSILIAGVLIAVAVIAYPFIEGQYDSYRIEKAKVDEEIAIDKRCTKMEHELMVVTAKSGSLIDATNSTCRQDPDGFEKAVRKIRWTIEYMEAG